MAFNAKKTLLLIVVGIANLVHIQAGQPDAAAGPVIPARETYSLEEEACKTLERNGVPSECWGIILPTSRDLGYADREYTKFLFDVPKAFPVFINYATKTINMLELPYKCNFFIRLMVIWRTPDGPNREVFKVSNQNLDDLNILSFEKLEQIVVDLRDLWRTRIDDIGQLRRLLVIDSNPTRWAKGIVDAHNNHFIIGQSQDETCFCNAIEPGIYFVRDNPRIILNLRYNPQRQKIISI